MIKQLVVLLAIGLLLIFGSHFTPALAQACGGGGIIGLVTDNYGHPIAKAYVMIVNTITRGKLEPSSGGPVESDFVSNSNGEFHSTAMSYSLWQAALVVVDVAGYGHYQRQIQIDQCYQLLRIRLLRPGLPNSEADIAGCLSSNIIVTVLDGQQTPVAEGMVEFFYPDSGLLARSWDYRTLIDNEDVSYGRAFVHGLPFGKLTMRVTAPGYRIWQRGIDVNSCNASFAVVLQ
jgi:hypothetical protein